MRHTVTLPKLGDTVEQVYVVEWLCAVGDEVTEGQGLLAVETDKVDAEVPSPIAGRVVELLVEPETEIPNGTPICVLEA